MRIEAYANFSTHDSSIEREQVAARMTCSTPDSMTSLTVRNSHVGPEVIYDLLTSDNRPSCRDSCTPAVTCDSFRKESRSEAGALTCALSAISIESIISTTITASPFGGLSG